MAVADDTLHENCIIEAAVEHSADRTRNSASENTDTRSEAGERRRGPLQAVASEEALSGTIVYWKDGSDD